MINSPLADYHVSQGATLGEYHGAMVPARFTDPAAENRAVRSASGLFDFSFRGKFRMKGRDHAKLLQRLVSNDVKKLTPGPGHLRHAAQRPGAHRGGPALVLRRGQLPG